MKKDSLVRHKLRTSKSIGIITRVMTMHESYSEVASVLGAEVLWPTGKFELLSFEVLEEVK